MKLWQQILHWLSARNHPGEHYYRLDENLYTRLFALAAQEGRPATDVVQDLVAAGLENRTTAAMLHQRWLALSPREQDVAALVCLGYTNRQIAVSLNISAETVKKHLSHSLAKLKLNSRAELRTLFASWDFSAWQP
jgi:DNA-binding CsgD family transcriptional regulator